MVYPNPGGNTLNICTALPNASVEIYDLTGNLVCKKEITENVTSINAESWPSGVYVWKVYTSIGGVSTGSTTLVELGKWIKEQKDNYPYNRKKSLTLPAKEKHQMEKKNTNENRSITAYKGDFEAIYGIIASHCDRVVQQINGESVMMVWEVGGFVSDKLKTAAWGSGVVRQLAEYIHTQDPTVRGWSYRTIYKMVQFYETYSSQAFIELIGHVKPQQIVPFEMAQIPNRQIVTIQLAQKK